MRFVIQRVNHASVTIEGKVHGSIQKGYVVLIGVGENDTTAEADRLVKKMFGLRIFADENGKTNLSLNYVDGELLLISQFTLYADCKKGNRPSFVHAGSTEHAEQLYEYIIEKCRCSTEKVSVGIFGADMKVSLENDGPFTIILDSDVI